MKYAAIADWAADKQYSVTFMCAQLGATAARQSASMQPRLPHSHGGPSSWMT